MLEHVSFPLAPARFASLVPPHVLELMVTSFQTYNSQKALKIENNLFYMRCLPGCMLHMSEWAWHTALEASRVEFSVGSVFMHLSKRVMCPHIARLPFLEI
jgi:hypothetical protein